MDDYGDHGDGSGICVTEHADAFEIGDQLKFAKVLISYAQKDYKAGKTIPADGARDEAERTVAEALGMMDGLDHPDYALQGEIRAVQQLLRNLHSPA